MSTDEFFAPIVGRSVRAREILRDQNCSYSFFPEAPDCQNSSTGTTRTGNARCYKVSLQTNGTPNFGTPVLRAADDGRPRAKLTLIPFSSPHAVAWTYFGEEPSQTPLLRSPLHFQPSHPLLDTWYDVSQPLCALVLFHHYSFARSGPTSAATTPPSHHVMILNLP